ncbi:MAG: alpha/beta hydrolase [Verrucomicrobia bacterium]|nr:alpha/beta hydrolase [Verrucomicrobiota bacterium]
MPLVALALAYLALVVVALLAADRMIHQPEMASRVAPAGLRLLRSTDGVEVAMVHLPHPAARFTLWFFHGNAESLADLEPRLRELRDAGFAVVAFDYPGYGRSGGRPTEASVYAAARVVRDYLRHDLRVPAERTILYGRSLGSGPAVQMATEERVGGLVVQSGFMSAFCVMTRWPVLPFDQFRNLAKLPRVECPVLVMHGEADEVIAVAHGRALRAAAPGPARHLWVADARHNDFIEVAGERFWRALREFAGLCATQPLRAATPPTP